MPLSAFEEKREKYVRKELWKMRWLSLLPLVLLFILWIFIVNYIIYDNWKPWTINLSEFLNIDQKSYKAVNNLSIIIYLLINIFVGKIPYEYWISSSNIKAFKEMKANAFTSRVENMEVKSEVKDISIETFQEKINPYNVNKPWHIQVSEIFSLIHNGRYRVKYPDDYYAEEKVFITSSVSKESVIALYCATDEPAAGEFSALKSFIEKQSRQIDRVIIAVENGEKERFTVDVNGLRVEYRFRYELITAVFDLESYRQQIFRQFEKGKVIGSQKTLQELYIDLDVVYEKDKTSDNDRLELGGYVLPRFLSSGDDDHLLIILGDYGSGKTAACLSFAYNMLKSHKKGDRIPFIIELRNRRPRDMSYKEILQIAAESYAINLDALCFLHQTGQTILIFDGFDEVIFTSDPDQKLNDFRSLWKLALPDSKLVMTGRESYFSGPDELKKALLVHEKTYAGTHRRSVHVQPFRKNQACTVIDNYNHPDGKRIKDIVYENDSFFNLVSKPSILFYVLNIWGKNKLEKYGVAITSGDVIAEFLNDILDRQSAKEIDKRLSRKELKFFISGLALCMYSLGRLSNQIHLTDFDNIINLLLKELPEKEAPYTLITENARHNLKVRIASGEYDRKNLPTDVRTSGPVVADSTRESYYKFSHRIFLEYLVSRHFSYFLLKRMGKDDKNKESYLFRASKKASGTGIQDIKLTPELFDFVKDDISKEIAEITFTDQTSKAIYLFKIIVNGSARRGIGLHAFRDIFFKIDNLFFFSLLAACYLYAFKHKTLTLLAAELIKPQYIISAIVMLLYALYVRYRVETKRLLFPLWSRICLDMNIDIKEQKKIVSSIYHKHLTNRGGFSLPVEIALLIVRFIKLILQPLLIIRSKS